ncbi:DUF3558 domain-containing protein [Pseudonocardia humida]|uniref:DUF3558 domain-containing protein n=1 Tax=Pseudonocardia humida TaxID=2800819 RepID=A0ABT0ZVP2_9PSEU|nr:DUF3558 family protein [Pseudonocardia humida]MCO1654810.1 DUF3558 domain-containing protein [Pseudonocardia humida]
MRRLLLLLLVSATVAACSTTAVPGQAAPSEAASSTQPGSVPLPTRPRDIALDGIDPCALLTAQQRAELGLQGEGVSETSNEPIFTGRNCTFRGYEPQPVVIGIALATENGIEVITSPGAVNDDLEPITVDGFPAVLARPRVLDFCSVDIDVAPDQFIDVQLADGGGAQPVPQESLCRDVVEIAEQVVGTLQSLRP